MPILFGKNTIRKNRLEALQEAYETLRVQTAPVLKGFEAGTAAGAELRRWGEQTHSVRKMYLDVLQRRELDKDPAIRSVLGKMAALQAELLRYASHVEESYRQSYMARTRERMSHADELHSKVIELMTSRAAERRDLVQYLATLESILDEQQDEAPFVPALIEHKGHSLMLLRYIRDRVWDLLENGGNGLDQISEQFERESEIRSQRLREASSKREGFTSII